jgi:site-specific DNA-methyltransferase (adenine-specific)
MTDCIYFGDCRDVMKSMSDKSFDLIVTSPPYNMNLRVRNGKHCSRQITKELTTKYNDYSDNLTMEEYYQFNKDVITECLRVSNLTFYNVQFLTGNKQALYRIMGEFAENIKEFIIWDKINAEPAIGEGVLNSRFEVLLVFASKEVAITRQFKNANFDRGELENLWQIKRGKKITDINGAIFPEELAIKIISNFSKEGDIILDPFGGTGTTAVACKKLDRRYVLIEKSRDYEPIIERRLQELKTLWNTI